MENDQFAEQRKGKRWIPGSRLLWLAPLLAAKLWPASSSITGIWANEGGDKVTQDELRVTNHSQNLTGQVLNRVWNGQSIALFGAQNEVLGFNLALEAGSAPATNVSIEFDTLIGPSGTMIHSAAAAGNQVLDWVNRPIELFYVRYLPIEGLSYFGYGHWDERQIPTRLQRPWTGAGIGSGGWTDRPDHDKLYPDILVPLELVSEFNIAAGRNQSIWSDIYIPKTALPGLYTGNVIIRENGATTYSIPVQLTVRNFSLPDQPSVKTMVYLDTTDIMWRYVSGYHGYTNWQTSGGQRIARITDKYYELFHRHKISLVGENECASADQPCGSSLPRLNGSLYTAGNGYDGPGVNSPNGLFVIGPYGTWGYPQYGVPAWRSSEPDFWTHTNNWVTWFDQNLPGTEYMLYLEDEPPPSDYAQVNTWAQWINANPGPGQRLLSFATHHFLLAETDMPDVDIPAASASMGACPSGVYTCNSPAVNQAAADFYRQTPGRKLMMYNDWRPATGTADTEDDGVAMRVLAWTQYKKQIDRWFYWYANVNTPFDWFTQQVTWGVATYTDPVIGQTTGNGISNGFGLLVYPGSSVYPGQTSYGIDGPIASLRLKEWRRGIQDTDYLALASRYDPAGVQTIVDRIIPYVLWEYPSQTPGYYTGSGVSWSVDPDTWEAARAELAQIISNHCASAGASSETNSPCAVSASGSGLSTSNVPPSTSTNSTATPLQFIPMTPCRLVDTRLPNDSFSGPYLQAGTSRTFTVPNSACAVPASAQAYALNVTVVPHGPLRWLTLSPSGQALSGISTLNSLDGRTKANAAITPAGAGGGISAYATDDTDLIIDITGYFVSGSAPNALAFYPVTPCRLVDTRSAAAALGGPSLLPKQERSFPIIESGCGLPTTAQAYSLNYTVIPKQKLGWLTTWPSGQDQPGVSTLNATTGTVTANAAITPAGQNGAISAYASDAADLIIDVNGYFAPPGQGGLSLYTLSPCRAFDTRALPGSLPLAGQANIDFLQSNCGVPSTAQVMVLNATTIPSGALGYLTLWPATGTQPSVSTLNAYDGQITSNLAIVPLTNGSLTAFTTDASHLIFDVFGYFAP